MDISRQISFFVEGIPVPKARARIGKHGAYTPKTTKDWEELVKWSSLAYKPKKSFTGPVKMGLTFYLKPPKQITKKELAAPHTRRPDVDNFCKAILDPLNGIFYVDDSQVYELKARKQWALNKPGVRITMEFEE